MRNIILFMMLLMFFNISCSKGDDPSPPSPPPPVAELEPSILEFSITPSDNIIPIYSDITVKYKGDINTKKISINGEDMPNIDGVKTYPRVGATTEYTVVATNVTKTVTKKITANVGDWKSSFIGVLTKDSWSNYSWKLFDGEVLILHYPVQDEEFAKKRWFWSINKTCIVYNQDGTPWGGSEPWDISSDGKNYLWGTSKKEFLIEKWTESEIILSRYFFEPNVFKKNVTEKYYFRR